MQKKQKELSSVKFTVHYDRQRRTCIVVRRDEHLVKFIPLELSSLRARQMTPILFDHKYQWLPTYSLERACQIYVEHAKLFGTTKECLNYLGQVISINQEEFMSNIEKTKEATSNKKSTVRRESAAQLFQDLIMEGKLTDDQIFKKVQEKYELDDKKRGYVGWYRNYLKKQGQTPPTVKVASKKAAVTTKTKKRTRSKSKKKS